MLTYDELLKRLERDREIFEQLTKDRETLRIRIYRYKQAIRKLEDINQLELGLGEVPN